MTVRLIMLTAVILKALVMTTLVWCQEIFKSLTDFIGEHPGDFE